MARQMLDDRIADPRSADARDGAPEATAEIGAAHIQFTPNGDAKEQTINRMEPGDGNDLTGGIDAKRIRIEEIEGRTTDGDRARPPIAEEASGGTPAIIAINRAPSGAARNDLPANADGPAITADEDDGIRPNPNNNGPASSSSVP